MDEQCRNLASAIASRPLPALLEQPEVQESQRQELPSALAIAETRLAPFDSRAIEGAARERLAAWSAMMRRNVGEGRDVLRALLARPFEFTPVREPGRRAYRFVGYVGLSQLVGGEVQLVWRARPFDSRAR